MKSLITVTLIALGSGLASTASAEPPTKTQREELNKLLDNGGITSNELDAFIRRNRPIATSDYKVTRRCDFLGAVKAGEYELGKPIMMFADPPASDCQNSDNVKVRTFRFQGDVTTSEVIAKMDKVGYRPGDWSILFALGADHPQLQRQSVIIALDTQRSDTSVPMLWDIDGKRCFFLTGGKQRDFVWSNIHSFVAVPK